MAAIAASHLQGPSSCQWRIGKTKAGEKLSYEEVRRRQIQRAFDRLAPFREQGILTYFCGDTNVERNADRFQKEYDASPLNPKNHPLVRTPLGHEKLNLPTNTNFWNHHTQIRALFPTLSAEQASDVARCLQRLGNTTLKHHLLETSPWQDPASFAHFQPIWLIQLVAQLNPQSTEEKSALDYFCKEADKVIAREKTFWKEHENPGEGPHVPIGWILWSRTTPIEESVDFILGIGEESELGEAMILEGFTDRLETTASDHHPVLATFSWKRKEDGVSLPSHDLLG